MLRYVPKSSPFEAWSRRAASFSDRTYLKASRPAGGATIKAGFKFDVPVRFHIDFLELDYTTWRIGQIPSIPVVEIRI